MDVAMSTPSTPSTPVLPTRSSQRDARRWIERQLGWERTLGALRNKSESAPQRRAA